MLGCGCESRSWFGIALTWNPVTDFSLKLSLLDPIFPGGVAQALMGIPQSGRLGDLGPAPGMWARGEGHLFLWSHRKLATSSSQGGAGSSIASVLSQHPRPKGPLWTPQCHPQTVLLPTNGCQPQAPPHSFH